MVTELLKARPTYPESTGSPQSSLSVGLAYDVNAYIAWSTAQAQLRGTGRKRAKRHYTMLLSIKVLIARSSVDQDGLLPQPPDCPTEIKTLEVGQDRP